MTRWLYSWLMWLLQPLVRRKLRRRARAEPLYGERIDERFGHYAPEIGNRAAEKPGDDWFFVWVHAVSLGETRAAAALVVQLRLVLPGMRLLLTHGTATGRAQGQELLLPGDIQVWQPWDTQGAVDRFLTHFQPRVGLLVETEMWPNLVAACAAKRVPLCLVNARLSDKSLAQAYRFSWLARPAYQGLQAVWAQSPSDAARLASLGAPVKGVLGNFKFDATPDNGQLAQGRAWRKALGRPVIIFANSREGEEELFLHVLSVKRAVAPVLSERNTSIAAAIDVQWLLVPRHPQRFDEVARLCEAQGFSVARRSQWVNGPCAADVWLGDSLGEMALYYAMSDVSLLGGSFAPLGGHNLIESTACECPVVMGPHTFNFSEAAELSLAAGATFAVSDLSAAVDRAVSLLQSDHDLLLARTAARDFGLAHRGAARRTAAAVREVLVAAGSSQGD